MASTTQDIWSKWLLQGRFKAVKQEQRETSLQQILYPIRDTLLSLAAVSQGDTVLDVGCGDGLIALVPWRRWGTTARSYFVIFQIPCWITARPLLVPDASWSAVNFFVLQ